MDMLEPYSKWVGRVSSNVLSGVYRILLLGDIKKQYSKRARILLKNTRDRNRSPLTGYRVIITLPT